MHSISVKLIRPRHLQADEAVLLVLDTEKAHRLLMCHLCLFCLTQQAFECEVYIHLLMNCGPTTKSKSEHAADDVGDLWQARIASQAVSVGDYIWLIGGWDPGSKGDGGEILNDIWRLDLNTWTWTEASVQVEDSYSTLTFI